MENHNNNDLEDLNNLMQEQEQRRKEKSNATKNKKSSPEYLALEKELREIEEQEIAKRKSDLKKQMAKLLK